MESAAQSPARIYETRLVPAIFRPLGEAVVTLARPKAGEHVLDAACGTGVVARLVAPAVGSAGRTVGIDYDPVMLAMAESLEPGIEWRQGDIQNLPFPDHSFDLVTCQQGLQFLPDRQAGAREFHRVLRDGGRVVLAIWTEVAKAPGHAALFAALGTRLGTDMSTPPPWSLADESEVRKLVTTAGFADVEVTLRSLRGRFPSARTFVEIMLDGSSKATRQALAQLPAGQRDEFIADVAARLQQYEAGGELEIPMETRLIVGWKR
jgi:SAM-dependent methyltransferase